MASHVRTTKGLTDKELAEFAREFREAKALEKSAASTAKALQTRILEELSLRGGEKADVCGLEIKRRVNTTRTVALEVLKAAVGTRLFRQVTKTVTSIHTDSWNAAVNKGAITPDVLEQVETVGETSPWIEVKDAS